MNLFKLEALKREFPFIDATVLTRRNGEPRDVAYLGSLQIKRVTRDFLNRKPQENSWSGSLVSINEWELISFVLENGEILFDVVKQESTSGSNYAHSGTYHDNGETVAEAIFRLGIVEQLRFIVQVCGGYNIVEHESQPDFCAMIYKPSREFTWQEVLEEELVAAIEEVQKEADF